MLSSVSERFGWYADFTELLAFVADSKDLITHGYHMGQVVITDKGKEWLEFVESKLEELKEKEGANKK